MKKTAVIYFFVVLIVAFAAVSYFSDPSFGEIPQSIVRTGETVLSVGGAQATSTAEGSQPTSSVSQNAAPNETQPAGTTEKKKVTAATQVASSETPTLTVSERAFVAKSFVGLLCHYKANTTAIASAYGDGSGDILMKGSGVIVNPEGYILTVRHLVDPKWTNWAYGSTTSKSMQTLNDNITFEYCEVATPTSDTLPDIAAIQRVNPNITVDHPFLYLATAFFSPPQGTLTDYEYSYLDFSLLKITDPMHNCAQFNACSLPTSYPYSPSLYSEVPQNGTSIINFGYPAELINSSPSTFNDFYLKGTLGYLKSYFGGDLYFKNKPFTFEWTANDVLEGRSGAPLMWKGHVVGIQTSTNIENSADDFALGMPAIQRILKENNLGNILMTN